MSRSRAPTMMLTAIAATVVIVSWVGDATRGRVAAGPAPARGTQLVEQPLIGLGAGVTVREIGQDTPFSLVALTGDLAGTSTRVRARHSDGSWGPWYQTEYETAAPDPSGAAHPAGVAEGPRGTDPVFVGTTTTVQIAVTRPLDAKATQPPPTEAKDLGYKPASREQPFGQNISAVLISPPQAPNQTQWTPPSGVVMPGQAPPIISRAEWGADESLRCGSPQYDNGIRAAVIHHTAGSNDYSPLESAGIVKAIYTYHSKTLGWCDIAYNALVDKYGQVFEGSAGGLTKAVEAFHTGGFNRNTWGVSMIGNFDDVPPTPIQLRTVGRLLGWRLGIDGVDPKGTVQLESAGSHYTTFPAGSVATLPTIFTHRDVGNTDCPGNAAYALMDEIRDIAAHFNDPPEELIKALQGGAIYDHWQAIGGMNSVLGAPTAPEDSAAGDARFVTFARGAMYWSPETGPQPVTGAIYDAWGSQSYERGPLGLPTSAEIQEPLQITQNFQHGTLNFERLTGNVTQVVDGITTPLATQLPSGPTVPAEHFSLPAHPGAT
ncbi:LGFP repeat-containing protein [Mycobacterium intracellulare]|uniref:LGFP repeat-containing protein n=2 Tax=Mycobacterium intracellulare subsp. chimaera TaxID=222805 RepID=A0ABT7PAG7_MYCIT|nr:LGFP repeat-containing protein [Mycobacterium intracellulare]ARR81041.1 N-acetylmuramoyl-L-alanine amidase [Mycobacterium intracellulare subsp. yongonense]MCF1815519.1 LGFP repeat-containing protein [Mycobacterium intracellulare subsp. intracellulare]MDM3930038.1 LGFP repeat-containing protein [Mycobacterium intracellulare subsp. chimaera]MDS0337423.1 LGFP repeat-containing protein [Mycobacterium intracellulare]